MMNKDIESVKVYQAALDELICKHRLAVNDLTEEQLAESIRQACACGDFQRHVCTSNSSQAVVYIPHAREAYLTGKILELEKRLERIANWTPLTTYPGLYDDLYIARLNLKHIQRYAKEVLNPPVTNANDVISVFYEFCCQRKIDFQNDDYSLCILPDGSGHVKGPGGLRLFRFHSLDQCIEGLRTNADPNVGPDHDEKARLQAKIQELEKRLQDIEDQKTFPTTMKIKSPVEEVRPASGPARPDRLSDSPAEGS